ncbi:MAG: hypothetical protein ACRDZN_09540 [Acidimicrobiales bacterium]
MKKRRVTLNLDEDIVEMLKGMDSSSLSAAANGALREALEVELHRRALGEWLDEMDAKFGPPTEEDFALADAVLDEAMGLTEPEHTQSRGAA